MKNSPRLPVLDGAAQILFEHGTERRLSSGLPQPLNVADGLGILPGYDNGQAVFPAEAVADSANLLIVTFRVAVILFPGVRIDGIPKQMRVYVLPVYMDADYRLKAGKTLLRELFRNLQGKFRRDLSRLEGQNHVVILDAVRLVDALLCVLHLARRMAGVAVQVSGQRLAVRLVAVDNVPNRVVQSAFPRQYFCDRHIDFPPSHCNENPRQSAPHGVKKRRTRTGSPRALFLFGFAFLQNPHHLGGRDNEVPDGIMLLIASDQISVVVPLFHNDLIEN